MPGIRRRQKQQAARLQDALHCSGEAVGIDRMFDHFARVNNIGFRTTGGMILYRTKFKRGILAKLFTARADRNIIDIDTRCI